MSDTLYLVSWAIDSFLVAWVIMTIGPTLLLGQLAYMAGNNIFAAEGIYHLQGRREGARANRAKRWSARFFLLAFVLGIAALASGIRSLFMNEPAFDRTVLYLTTAGIVTIVMIWDIAHDITWVRKNWEHPRHQEEVFTDLLKTYVKLALLVNVVWFGFMYVFGAVFIVINLIT